MAAAARSSSTTRSEEVDRSRRSRSATLEDEPPIPAASASRKFATVTLEKPVDDNDAETHYDLGLAYKEMGLYDEAIKAFDKTLRAPGREVQGRLMIGMCHRDQGQSSEAINQFKQGLHAEPSERERQSLHYEIGMTYESIGDDAESLYYFELVLKRDPGVRRCRGARRSAALARRTRDAPSAPRRLHRRHRYASMTTRTETDSMGPIEVDEQRYWGAQTQRSLENFRIGREHFPRELIAALATIKKASAVVNADLGLLPDDNAS